MTERFKRAYDLLIKAYFNDELKAGDCTACAVGNICRGWDKWKVLFLTDSSTGQDIRCPFMKRLFGIRASYDTIANELYKRSGGYTESELAQVEYLFEISTKYKHQEYCRLSPSEILADQYNGLKAVIELLMKFDGIADEGYTEKLKEKLVTV